MKTLTTLALIVATVSLAAPAVPAFAASADNGAVPYCTSNPGADANVRQMLQIELRNKAVLAIDNWNGCLKAITVDPQGKTHIAYYDETLSIVRQDS